jgi:tetratricopeptide (TPR) repeat protein
MSDTSSGSTNSAADARKRFAAALGAAFVVALAVNAGALFADVIPASTAELALPAVRAVRLGPGFGAVAAWLANACASALVVLLVTRLSGSLFAGAAAGLIFAVLPVHVEAVAWSDARAVPVAGALALGASLIWFWDARHNAGRADPARRGAGRIVALGLALVMLAVAGHLMPMAAAAPICVWAASSIRGRIRGQAYRSRARHWPVLAVVAAVFVWGSVRGDLPRFGRENELGGPAAWVDSLGCLAVPWRLLVDYRPLYADADAGSLAYGFVGIVAVMLLVRRLKSFPALAGGFTWVFLTLVLSLSVDHVYRADWALYVASVGFAWTVGEALALLPLRGWAAALAVLVAAYGARAISYQETFSSPRAVLEASEWLPVRCHGELARRYAMLSEAKDVAARVHEHKAKELASDGRTDLADLHRSEAVGLREQSSEIRTLARGAIARAELALGRDDPATVAARGEVEFRVGDYVKARAALEATAGSSLPAPTRSHALVLLGEIRVRGGDVKGAAAKYREAIDADKANPEAHFKLGAAFLAEDRASDAAAEFRLAAGLRPNDPAFQNALGRVFERMLRFPDAETAYARAVVLDPRRDEYQRDLEAVRQMLKGRQNDPEAAQRAFDEGLALERQGRLMEAAAAYQKAVQHVGGFHAAYYRSGLCKAVYGAQLRRFEERRHYLGQAIEHFKAALVLRPGHEPYLYALAQACADAGQPAESELVLSAILSANPREGSAHYRLAKLYAYAMENVAGAREHLRLAESFGVQPEREFVQMLDEIQAESNSPPLTDAEKARELEATAASGEGDILFETLQFTEAAAAYARAYAELEGVVRQAAVSTRARAAWQAGLAWERAKDLPKALEWYVGAAKLCPADERYVLDVARLRALVKGAADDRDGKQ